MLPNPSPFRHSPNPNSHNQRQPKYQSMHAHTINPTQLRRPRSRDHRHNHRRCIGRFPINVISILNRDALGHMIHLVHAHEPAGELKHVVAEGDDDELCVLGAFFDVGGYDGDLLSVSPVLWSLRVTPVKKVKGEVRWLLTLRKSSAASISSMTYSGVGL